MRHADVDDVRKTLNAALEMIEFKIEVTVLQQRLQFTHRRGIILCIIEGEIPDLQGGQYVTEYQNMTNLTFAVMPARSRI